MSKRISHVIGFDDAPFASEFRGDVALVGAVFAGARLEGVLRGRVRRDGVNSTRVIVELVRRCRFREHLQAVMLQGIAVAGFNVVDINRLQRELGLPVIVVSRQRPDLDAVRRALLEKVPGGRRKWRLIQAAGPPAEAAGVWIQRAGIPLERAQELVGRLAVHGRIPEPLRTAHLIASAFAPEGSRQRV
jgi:endonuclease V-like protein UPF0215 family